MAKLTLTRFPDPWDDYDREQFAELVRQLEDLILQKTVLMQLKKMIQKPSNHIKTKFDKTNCLIWEIKEKATQKRKDCLLIVSIGPFLYTIN